MKKKDLEEKIIDAHYSGRLEVIREIQTYNENYLQNEVLNMELESLKSKYIFEYRRKNNVDRVRY